MNRFLTHSSFTEIERLVYLGWTVTSDLEIFTVPSFKHHMYGAAALFLLKALRTEYQTEPHPALMCIN